MAQSRTPLIITFVLLLLLLLYVGSYCAIVVPATTPRASTGIFNGKPCSVVSDEHYRVSPQLAAYFYWPLEKIHRRLRPQAWKPKRTRLFTSP
jgi:hypothetical protein